MRGNLKNGKVIMDGTETAYVSFGHGPKKLVVIPTLEDGLATVQGKAYQQSRSYRKFFEDFTVYMFSRKNELPEEYSIREMAADLARTMEHVGIRRACVMGASQGGMIAQYLASDYPDMVERLALVVTAPYANETIRRSLGKWVELAEKGDHRELMISIAEKDYSEKFLKKYRRIYPIIGFMYRPKDYRRFLIHARAIFGFDARPALQNIHCPTLIVGGGDDTSVGTEGSYALKELLPESQLYIYEGLRHAAYAESDDFYDRLLCFMKGGEF